MNDPNGRRAALRLALDQAGKIDIDYAGRPSDAEIAEHAASAARFLTLLSAHLLAYTEHGTVTSMPITAVTED